MDFKVYSNSWLLSQLEAEPRPKYIYFWGHQPNTTGEVTASCFSQWWPSAFEVDGERFATAEHWMMAAKAPLFGCEDLRSKILETEKPGAAKALGRQVSDFDQTVWEQHRYKIVVEGNVHKFRQHKALKTFLRNTHTRVLVEASPVDTVWGVGLAKDDERIEDPRQWQGDNLLSYALMSVRDMIV